MDKDLAQDLCALIEQLQLKLKLNNLTDIAVVAPKGTNKYKEQLDNQFKEKNMNVQIVPLNQFTKTEIGHKTFVFVLLPRAFLDLKLESIISKIDDFTNASAKVILVTSKATKKVKKYPFFTSHINNLEAEPKI